MDHSRASGLLTQYVSEDLEPHRHRAVEEHLERCENCRSWIDTYRLLAESLSVETVSATAHLSSQEVAIFALAPHELDEAARANCETHVHSCGVCREEVEVVTAAVSEARAGRNLPWRRLVRVEWPGVSRAPLAWAASLVLLVGVLVIGQSMSQKAETLHLSGDVFHGEKIFRGQKVVLVEGAKVSSGATVTLQAGDVVAFGEGFSVDLGGSLAVSVAQDLDPSP